MIKLRILMLAFIVLVAAACGSSAPADTASTASNSTPAADAPAWLNLEQTNARTGEKFKLADFAGKTVYVQPMATWCTNCRREMKTLIEVKKQVDPNKVVFVGFSVEDGLEPKILADYVDDQGFDWVFAVATPELGKALVDRFGQSVITPPTTPHFIIAPDGTVSNLLTGYQDEAAVVALLNQTAGS